MIGNAEQMDLSFLAKDNIDEILIKVVEFTRLRHEVISENIKKCHLPSFIPRRLDAEEFANVISAALAEHLKNSRLVLCDSQCVRFGIGGELSVSPRVDSEAALLRRDDHQSYIQLQEKRLRENIANNRIAVALYEQKARKATQTAEQTTDNHL